MERLIPTLFFLKNAGVKEVIIFGPTPLWRKGLPKHVFSLLQSNSFASPPHRIKDGLDNPQMLYALNRELRSVAKTFGFSYVSPLETFCNDDGCLVKIGEELTSFDTHHLAPSAARFLIEEASRNGLILSGLQ